MYVIVHTDDKGIWQTVNTTWVNPNNMEEKITEPLFFETFDEAVVFAINQFVDGEFEIMGQRARGEVKDHELQYLYNEDQESIIEEYK